MEKKKNRISIKIKYNVIDHILFSSLHYDCGNLLGSFSIWSNAMLLLLFKKLCCMLINSIKNGGNSRESESILRIHTYNDRCFPSQCPHIEIHKNRVFKEIFRI